jgi:hypothetical protein
MTVKELIQQLKQYDASMQVVCNNNRVPLLIETVDISNELNENCDSVNVVVLG